uniref:Uncharacterized protein n=1 Tax=Lepeophtheirus salmonis TaxID=72036 RepID=A0A0K2V9N3_LEPSM
MKRLTCRSWWVSLPIMDGIFNVEMTFSI